MKHLACYLKRVKTYLPICPKYVFHRAIGACELVNIVHITFVSIFFILMFEDVTSGSVGSKNCFYFCIFKFLSDKYALFSNIGE